MQLRGKFGVMMLAVSILLGSVCIAAAGMGGSMDQQTSQAANTLTGNNNQSEADIAKSYSTSTGAVRVDRDFGAFHRDDSNQFGDDRAYDSGSHANKEADYHRTHWMTESYGLGGNYGRDMK
jgi:hypothetical protein